MTWAGKKIQIGFNSAQYYFRKSQKNISGVLISPTGVMAKKKVMGNELLAPQLPQVEAKRVRSIQLESSF